MEYQQKKIENKMIDQVVISKEMYYRFRRYKRWWRDLYLCNQRKFFYYLLIEYLGVVDEFTELIGISRIKDKMTYWFPPLYYYHPHNENMFCYDRFDNKWFYKNDLRYYKDRAQYFVKERIIAFLNNRPKEIC